MALIIRFKIRSKRKTTHKDLPHYISIRLRVNGVPAKSDIATGVSVATVEDWDNKKQLIRGRADLTGAKNEQLKKMASDITEIFNLLRSQNKPVSAEIIKQIYTGKSEALITGLLQLYEAFVKQHDKNVNKDTLRNWKCRQTAITAYVRQKLKRKDVELSEISPRWANDYYAWYQTTRKTGKSVAGRAIGALKTVLNFGVNDGALTTNPLSALTFERDPPKPIVYLNESEVAKIANCPFFDARLQQVADCFLLQCYTGMAYNEMLAFDAKKHLQTDSKGASWIIIYRGKTKELCRIPLLAAARVLLEKYDKKMPLITNQKMNTYLKEVGKLAQLDNYETLTTHVGRRTMGTFLLNKGVSIEVVSKVLGHASIKITERHYAALLTTTIGEQIRSAGLF